jgi:transposase
MKYMGIDHHSQYFIAVLADDKGRELRKDRVSMDRTSIRHYFDQFKCEELAVAMEASYGWSYFYDEVKALVKEVKMAHPYKTKAIAEARIKTDTLDAATLAHLLRAGLIVEAYAPDRTTRQKKNLLRYRSALVKTRTMLKNRVHAVLSAHHIEDRRFRDLTDKFGKQGRDYMRKLLLQGHDRTIVSEYLYVIDTLDGKIKAAEKLIREEFRRDEICRLLETLPGVGKILAVTIRYEIDDIGRFLSAQKLCSYAGLVPSTYSSGGKTYQGKITKQGNRWLRWAMIEAAQQAGRRDPWLAEVYERIAKKGKKKARVAVARKLLEVVYRIWKEKRPYEKRHGAVALPL